jgi:hypothetical protein
MKLKGIDINSCKVFAVMIIAAFVFAAGAMLMSTNQCFAKTVYSDDNVTATVNDDGISGTLEIKDSSLYVTDSTSKYDTIGKALTNINGTALKDIIKFNDEGCIGAFWITKSVDVWQYSMLRVMASGPRGLGSGSGHLKFYDSEGDDYSLSIWQHSYSGHWTRVWGGDRAVKITKIEWWS